jgi:hypothetical protein
MRTTLDIDDVVLGDLKRLQAREGKSMGRLVSELLAPALAKARSAAPPSVPFRWKSVSMGQAKVDMNDRDALLDALDEPHGVAQPTRPAAKRRR